MYSNGFSFQSILADRYIHRRELRLVSIVSLSSAEYVIKKIFLIFVFYREISRFKLDFIHLFSKLLTKILTILMKFKKIYQENVVDFTFKDKIYCRLLSIKFFVTNSGQLFHKIQTFSSKTAKVSLVNSD